jgi:tol-pal system protein YbgF
MMSSRFSPSGVSIQLRRPRRLMAVLAFLLPFALAGPASAQLFGGGDSSDSQRRTAEMSMRINQLEGQLRQMNGQLEQMGYQVKQLNDLIVRMQKDYELRLQDLESAGAKKPAPLRKSEATLPDDATQVGRVAAAPTAPAGAMPYPATPSAVVPLAAAAAGAGRSGPGAPPASLGTLSSADPIGGVIGSDAPMDLSAPPGRRSTVNIDDGVADDTPPGVRLGPAPVTARTAAAAPMPPAAPATSGTRAASLGQPVPPAADQYDAAYGYMLSGEYGLAETSFKAFLADHPTDRRAASGQYWLGESFYSRKMFKEAADAFLTSYQQYPSSPKAPDSLLKLGLALNGLGEKKAACASFDELIAKYPKASKALRDLATSEKNKAKCG